jgi:transposase-like protein
MVHKQEINCPYCSSNQLQKNGLSITGTQRFRCISCNKYFQSSYQYEARKVGIKDQIIEMTLNSSGVRDIARTLHIHRDTVTGTLKKNASNKQCYVSRISADR